MGYILYIQTPGHMYSTTQRWGGEYRQNVDSPFGKGVPLPQLLLTYKGDSDLFKIHHSAFQTVLFKINF